MFAASRQASQLHRARLAMDEGQDLDRAFPRLHFSRKDAIALALRNLSAERLSQSMLQIGEATLEVRRRPQLAEAIAQRVLMGIAVNARRRG
jgi:DNA polymerase III subunit delta